MTLRAAGESGWVATGSLPSLLHSFFFSLSPLFPFGTDELTNKHEMGPLHLFCSSQTHTLPPPHPPSFTSSDDTNVTVVAVT